VVGLALARALAVRGAEVLVIEARRTGAGASGASAGILPAPKAGGSFLKRLARSAHAGYPRFVEELREETGLDAGLRRTGSLELALTPEEERRRAGRSAAGSSPPSCGGSCRASPPGPGGASSSPGPSGWSRGGSWLPCARAWSAAG
jgi:glycine/D-amino acid oxidase-like deaminating enzyme